MTVRNTRTSEMRTRFSELTRYVTADQCTVLMRSRDGTRLWVAGGSGQVTNSLRMLQSQRAGAAEIPICFRIDYDHSLRHIWQPKWMVSMDDERLRYAGEVPTEFTMDEDWLDERPALPQEENLFQESDWQIAVNRIRAEIARGSLRKAVLSRQVELWHTHAWPVTEITGALLAQSENTCVFAHHFRGGAVWLGATPETLYHREGRQVSVDSLAGTRRTIFEADKFTDKDHSEQEIVTQFLLRAMEPLCERVTLAPQSTKRADGLEHVYTQLNGVLKSGVGDDELLAALHPTPAVCGFPRAQASELINKLETQPRELYSGVLGYSTGHATTAMVVLRCAKIQDSTARLYGGAGVVAESNAEQEYVECGWKMDVLRRALMEVA